MSDFAPQVAPLPRLTSLRQAMLALAPSGQEGFEGLLARLLAAITGQPFRLARAGTQNGKDGGSSEGIVFEAKRYDDRIPDNEIFTKVFQVGAATTPPNLWILGATVGASTQTVDTLTAGGSRLGVGVLILDWPDAASPPALALACALAPAETAAFLSSHLSPELVAAASAEMEMLRGAPGFAAAAADLRARLAEPSLAPPNARAANAAWLRATFDDRAQARAVFGQALAPGGAACLPTRDRADLVASLEARVAAARSGEIVALLGGEGCGKSWLFAQAWLGQDAPPLTVVIPARSLDPTAAFGQIEAFLIGRLLAQTGEVETETARERWKTRLLAWGPREDAAAPRFILFIDGLNERPDFDWPHWLSRAATMARDKGGVIVVSARTAFFRDRVQLRLATIFQRLDVPEWTRVELEETLTTGGVDPARLSGAVLERLRNPRLLGIAFDLLGAARIETFAELSVERLLFEHIRLSAQEGPTGETVDVFARRLADHAREVLDRVRRQHGEDRLVFGQLRGGGPGYELTPDLAAVIAEHFFRPLAEDTTLYALADDGLVIALGFSIIKALQQAERAGRDVPETLGELLDPVAALDRTAEAMFAALMVASVDDRVSEGVRKSLMLGLLALQNLDMDRYSAFVGVVRNIPRETLAAVDDLVEKGRTIGNQDWLVSALRDCRADRTCWSLIAAQADRWLRTYSLDPALSVFPRQPDNPNGYQDNVANEATKLANRLAGLPPEEKHYLETALIRRDAVDPADLWRRALELIAGMPQTGFADALVACAYAMALHSSFQTPHDEFRQAVQFNTRDWAETRDALAEAATRLRADGASDTARWALVEILRSVSTPEDAEEEARLVTALTVDRVRHGAWRLVEDYSPADPCDPASVQKGDLARAISEFEAIDLAAISAGSWMGREDHFLEDAGPAVARFAPDLAVSTYRRIAHAVLARPPAGNRIGVISLKANSAVFDADTVAQLVDLALETARPPSETVAGDRDLWLISQYALLMAFPHLDGDAQVSVLQRLPPHETAIVALFDTFVPCRAEAIDAYVQSALHSGDRSAIMLALSYARTTGLKLAATTWNLITPLLVAEPRVVRALAMGVLAVDRDPGRLTAFVASGWTAATLDRRRDFYEAWFGSWALIIAAELDLLPAEELLIRIAPTMYGEAIKRVGPAVHAGVAARVRLAAKLLLEANFPDRPPLVEQAAKEDADERSEPPRMSLGPTDEVEKGPRAFFRNLGQSEEAFQKQQRDAWTAVGAFIDALSPEDARLAIENPGFDVIEVLAADDPAAALALARRILEASEAQLPALANLGLMLVPAISAMDPVLACDLIVRLGEITPYLRLTFGRAGVPLDVGALWRCVADSKLDRLRTSRLDDAPNDHLLALEVQAAVDAGCQDFLEAYADARLAETQPTRIGRGLMVLGFGLETETATRRLAEYAETKGIVGRAAKAALHAYDRNRWARHWRDRMIAAETPAEVWLASILFTKLIDGRLDAWPKPQTEGAVAGRFAPTLNDRVGRRIGRWKSKREGKLLGGSAPSSIYLVATSRF